MRKTSLRNDLARALDKLNDLPGGAVILDGTGCAWQYGGNWNPYWYRSFGDDSFVSSYELSQIIDGKFTVIHPRPTKDP